MPSYSFIESQMKRLAPESPCLLIGQPGVGKTQFAEYMAGVFRLKFVKLRCDENGDNGDLIGLLKEENGIHYHTTPKWASYNEPIFLFLDEINRAKKDVINAIMELCTDSQEFNGHKLVKGSRVVCAMNPSNVMSNDVDELNRAMYSRCARFFVEPSKSDWILWASTHCIHQDIIDYIDQSDEKHLFNMNDVDSSEDENTINPRSWENVSKMYTNGCNNGDYSTNKSLIKYDVASWVGETEANEFYSWLTVHKIFNAFAFLVEGDEAKIKKSTIDVANLLDTYRVKICDNVMQTLINILSDNSHPEYYRRSILNFYALLDRLNVEQAARLYTLYIEPKVKLTIKPDWFTRLAHTDEYAWSKIKTIIQGKKKTAVKE